ncbi:hypothetical protein BDV24DRAFT_127948 [Aspergillus arachidicola]|uniref:Secreted protein n=1 Tax=Aspergillus arachidicola TaxID=656916 RepID=A0A5N6YKD5_9EURO|nr:hypothetical protein BDV24DRAFT_127948 [Aspergillus arachidicola]
MSLAHTFCTFLHVIGLHQCLPLQCGLRVPELARMKGIANKSHKHISDTFQSLYCSCLQGKASCSYTQFCVHVSNC